MILNVELPWGMDNKIREMTKAQRDTVRENVLSLSELKEPEEGKEYYSTGIYGKFLVSESEFEFLTSLGVKLTIVNFKNTYAPKEADNGAKYHFHLPNIALMMFDEVTWIEDACTQALQDQLNDGWRMIAVCPPNGARRPDYILARTKGAK